MNEPVETTSEVLLDAVAYNSEKAAIDSQVATAKNFPRNMKRAIDNAITTVTLDKETAQSCTYSLPRSGKQISGPSVHLARIIAQLWGNIRVESKIVSVDARQVVCEAVCFDLETNYAVKAQWRQSIIHKDGRRYNDDLIGVTGQAGASKAFRNAVFAVIPKAVVDKIHTSAKQFTLGDISDEQKFSNKRKKIVEALRDTYSVTEKEILASVSRAALDHLTAEDLVTLIGIGTAIKDGEITVDAAFRPTPDKKSSPLEKTEEPKIEVKDKTKKDEGKKDENKLPL